MRGLNDDEYLVLAETCRPGEIREPNEHEEAILRRLADRKLVTHSVYEKDGDTFERWTVNPLGLLAHRVEVAFRSTPSRW